MSSWRKLLAAMVADSNPRSYTYTQAAGILVNLGFGKPRKAGTSHRKFRIELIDPNAKGGKRGVVIGLTEHGSGPLPPKYITQMVQTLRENNLLPSVSD